MTPASRSRMPAFALTRLEDRLTPAYSLDTTFASGGLASAHFGFGNDVAQAVAVQADGRIILAGYARVGSDNDVAVVRLNADGSRDTTFGTNGRVTVDAAALLGQSGGNDSAAAVAIDQSGRIVLAGAAFIGADNDFLVVRLNPNGTRDTTFSGDGVQAFDFQVGNDIATGVAVLGNGQLIVSGAATTNQGYDFGALRFNTNGTLDTSFGTNGARTVGFQTGDDIPFGLVVKPSGQIVMGGGATINGAADFAVVQLLSNGNADPAFGDGFGRAAYDFNGAGDSGTRLGVYSDGSIGLFGTATFGGDRDFAMVKFGPTGVVDTSFGTGGRFVYDFGYGDDIPWAFTNDGADGIILVGSAKVFNDTDFAAVRINLNGQLDTSFGAGGKLTQDFELNDDVAYGALVQPDGRLILAGAAGIYGDTDFAAVRFAPTTTLVSTNNQDSDGDGLLDQWETNGIDANNDGTIDLNLAALGANPYTRDLFIEVDAMSGLAPNPVAIQMVVGAFATHNIALHVVTSDINIPVTNWAGLTEIGFPTAFAPTRAQYFGTAAERASPNWPNIQQARDLAFRYCLFVNQFEVPGQSGPFYPSGVTNGIIAQEFVVSLGGGHFFPYGGSIDTQAGTFMHELGHALGLRHHGGEDLPNPSTDYSSVMNYRFQFGVNQPPNSSRLDNFPNYSESTAVYPDWQRLVFNWRTGRGATQGLDAPRPAPTENDAPVVSPGSSIALSNSIVSEFRPAGTVVGTLSVSPSAAATFALVTGQGATDNALFAVSGNQLVTLTPLDAATVVRTVRVRAVNGSGQTIVEQALTIGVTDNLAVTRVGRTLNVSGTNANDSYSFTAGPTDHAIVLNGVNLAVRAADVDLVWFDGGAGADTAYLTTRGTGNSASFWSGSTLLAGTGYSAVALAETTTAYGGSTDGAYFNDSAGNDVYVAAQTYAFLQGAGRWSAAVGFGGVTAYASTGTDAAYLLDSTGNDVFVAYPSYAFLTGPGFWNTANGFDGVTAYASSGSDAAYLNGSAGDDVFSGQSAYSFLTGSGYWNTANGFDGVNATGGGGNDAAYLTDSAGDDTVNGSGAFGSLSGPAYYIGADGFDAMSLYGTNGGTNRRQVGVVSYWLGYVGTWV